jgi:hypothetical protein
MVTRNRTTLSYSKTRHLRPRPNDKFEVLGYLSALSQVETGPNISLPPANRRLDRETEPNARTVPTLLLFT